MATFSRKNLSRAVKLTVEHAFKLPEQIAAAVAAVGLDGENIEKRAGLVELHFRLEALDQSGTLQTGSAGVAQYLLPFVLPPLQEFWSAEGVSQETTPTLRLETLSFSFDTRGEPAAITSVNDARGIGKLDFPGVEGYDLTLTLSERSQWYHNQGQVEFTPDRQLLSLPLPPTAFADSTFRLNPLVLENLALQLNPYRTYVFGIAAPKLTAAGLPGNYVLPSVHVALGIRTELVERDKGSGIQNMPAHLGAQTPETISITRPVKNTVIRAGAATGLVDGALWKLDALLSRKLAGGYYADGRRSAVEHIKPDACYDVIAIPFFNNERSRIVTAGTVGACGWAAASPALDYVLDQKRIPLQYPISVHHVVAIANYAAPYQPRAGGSVTPNVPASPTFYHHVGLGIYAAGDSLAEEQIAQAKWFGNQPTALLIDRVKQNPAITTNGSAWSHELRSVPLTMRGAEAGAGYYAQGKPFFAANGTHLTYPRTNVGTMVSGANAAPLTLGREAYLLARWKMQDTAGLEAAPLGGALNADTVYVGYGGHWMLVFGKRHLAGSENERPY